MPFALDQLPQFRSAPTSWQFAKGGAWEQAWSLPGGRLPSHAELIAYLADSTEVAFEAFFGSSFFGARFAASSLDIEGFATKCLHAVRAQQSFFDVFRDELGGPLPNQQASFAEVGCVNAWRSVGAVRIPQPQQAAIEFERLWLSVSDSPVGRDRQHAKAIEFAFEHPFPHWFALPVSAPGESNLVCEDLLRQAIELVATRASSSTQNPP